MPNVEEQISVRINQSNTDPPTCFGLPGSGGIQASWSNVKGTVTLKAMDNGHLYGDFSLDITDSVISNDYRVVFIACRHDFSWGSDAGADLPSDTVEIARTTVNVPGSPGAGRGDFVWNIRKNNVDLGTLESWGASIQDDDGFMWLSGTGTYHVDDPIYPDPYRLTVPGFIQLFDYYPCAVLKGGQWKSCNRSGGGFFIRKGGAWRDVKNSRQNDADSQFFERSGSSWTRTPLVGSET